MRFVSILIMMAAMVMLHCQPAIPGKVTVTQGGKRHEGWSDDRGKIGVMDPGGETIMHGTVSRMGSVELTTEKNSETYVGKVNLMGQALLMSPRTGDTIRIEVER